MLTGKALLVGAGLFDLVREEQVTTWWQHARML